MNVPAAQSEGIKRQGYQWQKGAWGSRVGERSPGQEEFQVASEVSAGTEFQSTLRELAILSPAHLDCCSFLVHANTHHNLNLANKGWLSFPILQKEKTKKKLIARKLFL